MPWWGIALIVFAVIVAAAAALFLWGCLWVSARADREMERVWREATRGGENKAG